MAKKIIIIDDDKDILILLLSAFKSRGFEVHGIGTGAEALNYLLDKKNLDDISLIILDRILPDMDGLDILKQFINKFHSKIPVLILSVLSSEADMLSGISSGAIDYIAKPFSIPILISKVQALIAHYTI